jgi:hypothetical protein
MFETTTYDNIHPLAIGKIGEYWAKLALTLKGLDVYTSEVDNRGIDFVVKNSNGKYFDIQVKSIRYPSTSYVFMRKEFEWAEGKLRDNLYLALIIIRDNKVPETYLIPSSAWKQASAILKNREYRKNGLQSNDEWGVNYSQKNLILFEPFKLEKQILGML